MNAAPLLPSLPTTAPASLLFPGAAQLDTPLTGLADWQLVAARLRPIDADAEHYTVKEIAPLLGHVTYEQLLDHAQDLWPKYEGCYKLNLEQAIKLIKRYCQVGRKKFPRAQMEQAYRQLLRPQSQPIFN